MTAPVATEEKPAERPVAGDAATATPVQPEIGGGDSAAGGLTGPPGALMRTGLIASLSVHLLVVAVVAASFLASGAPKQTEVIPVELVPNEPVAEDKAPGAAGSEQAEPGSEPTPDKAVAPPEPDKAAPPAEPDKPAPPPAAEQTSAEKKTPSPPADAADAFEPVHIVPPLASLPFDSVGLADSGRDTTVTKEEIEGLRAAVSKCWQIPSGWTSPRQVSVTVRFHLNKDGTLKGKPAVVEFPASRLGKAAADNAVIALAKCAPYHLPPEKYAQWSDVQLRLVPRL